VALVDSDLRSINPEWMNLLIGPTLEDVGFVAPYYNRRKYDGTITNFLCYPVMRSLFGQDIRQPIGGDFGLSLGLVEKLLESSLWDEVDDVSRFGIDLFETYTALAEGFKVKQARLGVKNLDAKEPSSQLVSMFRQVMNSMFTCIEHYQPIWKNIKGVQETELVGETKYGEIPETIEVSFKATIDAFNTNYNGFIDIYRSVLDSNTVKMFDKLKQLENINIDFTSEVWAKTVYSFIAA
jgi:glucosylglycerate synthase